MTVVYADAPGEWYNSPTGVWGENNGTAKGFGVVDGRMCMQMPPGGNVRQTGIANNADFSISASVKFTNNVNGGLLFQLFRGLDGGAHHADVCRVGGGAGQIAVTRNGAVIAATPGHIPYLTLDVWHWLSLGIHVADAPNGTWEVNLNGVVVLSGSGDTRNGAGTGITRLQIGNENPGFSGNPAWYVRDIVMIVGSAASLMPRRVSYLNPDGAGNSTQWTPQAGTNWQNVDERDGAPDDATTYNKESTNGDIDLYALSALPETPASIMSVTEVARLAKDDATAQTARRVLRTGGNNFESGDLTLATTWGWFNSAPRETNPNTGVAWTASEIAALEMGVKKQA